MYFFLERQRRKKELKAKEERLKRIETEKKKELA